MRYICPIFTLLFGVAVILFFGMAYPHHLHYQEQFQLFLFDSTYLWDIVKQPGGVADLLGRFCTQFFLYAWVGAVIIGVLLVLVQLLTFQLVQWSMVNGQWSMFNDQCSMVNDPRIAAPEELAAQGMQESSLRTFQYEDLIGSLADGELHRVLKGFAASVDGDKEIVAAALDRKLYLQVVGQSQRTDR